jgi:HEAT repeat protein
MEQDDHTPPSLSDKTSPLTVDAPPDLLPRLLAPLGLQASITASHVEWHPDTILTNLRSQKWTERVTALQTLSKLNMPIPLDLVTGALNDENQYVRATAARALEKASDHEASQPLIAALRDSSWSVRAAAAQTLGKLGSSMAIERLVETMREDEDEAVRASAAKALGQMRDAIPLEPLLQALQDHTSWLVREAAVSALGNAGQRVPLEPLLMACQDSDTSVRQAALIALRRTHPEAEVAAPATNTIDLIAQSQTQPLPEQATIPGATPQASKRLLSLFAAMKRLLVSVHRSVAYDPERAATQHIPLPSRPPRRLVSKTQLLLRIGVVLLTITGAIFTSFILFGSHQSTVGNHAPSACPPGLVTEKSSGCASFKNSLDPTTASQNIDKGLNDILEIDLINVPAPVSGKSYYAWLLSSPGDPEGATVFLHQFTSDHGDIHYVYQDPQQRDLLAATSAFLITEEPDDIQPLVPSLDRSTWRYYSALSQIPDPNDTTNHYSIQDHLYHLLTADPQLERLNLHGGLSIWLQRNSQAIRDLAQTAHNAFAQHDAQTVRTQLISILDYLDSSVYVAGDVPAGTALQIDPTVARVALLTFDSLNQMPEGYLQHIAYHLDSIIASPYATSYQKALATELVSNLSRVETKFQQVRTDAKSLVNMSDSQLLQSNTAALLDSLATQTSRVHQGQADTTIGKSQQDGVSQLYQATQTLATFDVQGVQ